MLLTYRIQHSIICFRLRATYNLNTAPNTPVRFGTPWEPPLVAASDLSPFPKVNTPLAGDYFYLPGPRLLSPSHAPVVGRSRCCILVTPRMLNTRLCMIVPFLVAGCHPPFTVSLRLIVPCDVFQLSILRAVYENRTRSKTLATFHAAITSIPQTEGNNTEASTPLKHLHCNRAAALQSQWRVSNPPFAVPTCLRSAWLFVFVLEARTGIEPASPRMKA